MNRRLHTMDEFRGLTVLGMRAYIKEVDPALLVGNSKANSKACCELYAAALATHVAGVEPGPGEVEHASPLKAAMDFIMSAPPEDQLPAPPEMIVLPGVEMHDTLTAPPKGRKDEVMLALKKAELLQKLRELAGTLNATNRRTRRKRDALASWVKRRLPPGVSLPEAVTAVAG